MFSAKEIIKKEESSKEFHKIGLLRTKII